MTTAGFLNADKFAISLTMVIEAHKMHVELIAITPNAEAVIEKAGRTCYCSIPKAQPANEKNFIYRIIKSGHHTEARHCELKIKGRDAREKYKVS